MHHYVSFLCISSSSRWVRLLKLISSTTFIYASLSFLIGCTKRNGLHMHWRLMGSSSPSLLDGCVFSYVLCEAHPRRSHRHCSVLVFLTWVQKIIKILNQEKKYFSVNLVHCFNIKHVNYIKNSTLSEPLNKITNLWIQSTITNIKKIHMSSIISHTL